MFWGPGEGGSGEGGRGSKRGGLGPGGGVLGRGGEKGPKYPVTGQKGGGAGEANQAKTPPGVFQEIGVY